jgi:hypothetical protein
MGTKHEHGGLRPGAGRPRGSRNKRRKLARKQRVSVVHDYISLHDRSGRSRAADLRSVAHAHGISPRMAETCLEKLGVRRTRARMQRAVRPPKIKFLLPKKIKFLVGTRRGVVKMGALKRRRTAV